MSIEQEYVVTARRNNLKVHLFEAGNTAFMFDLSIDPGEHEYLESVDSPLVQEAVFYLTTPLFSPQGNCCGKCFS